MSTFVILTKENTHYNFEINRIFEESKLFYEKSIILDPINISYLFEFNENKLLIFNKNNLLEEMSTIHVRSTRNRQNSITLFCHVAEFVGSNLSDPIKRFNLGRASKIVSTFKRFSDLVGASSFICFNKEYADLITKHWEFPILYKPVEGKQGRGIFIIKNQEEFTNKMNEHFADGVSDANPILLQKLYIYKREYRVVIYDNVILGAAEKIQEDNSKIQKNYSQGAYFVKCDHLKFKSFVQDCNLDSGLYGIDVGELVDGAYQLIENNRSPKFEEFENCTNINLAREIVKIEYQKLDK